MKAYLSVVGIALTLGSCAPASGPTPSNPALSTGAEMAGRPVEALSIAGSSAHEWIASPPPFSVEQLSAEIERLEKAADLEAIPAEPQVGAPGPQVISVDPKRVAMDQSELVSATLSRDAVVGDPGRRVQSHQRVFARVPTAQMGANGQVELRFETTISSPGASAYYGTIMPSGAVPVTRYRKQTRAVKSDEAGRQHLIEVPANQLLADHYDVHDARSTGRGWVAWRVEVLDSERGSSRVFDGVTPFRCSPVPCGKDATFVQLPAIRLGPVVDLVGPDEATISFTTDAPTSAVVVVQAEGHDPKRFASQRASTHHEIELRGLASSTRYRYHVLAIDRRGEVVVHRGATFRTAPPHDDANATVTFVALSDARSGIGSTDEHYAGTNMSVLRGLLGRGLEYNPGFVLFVGDLVDGYTTEPGSFRFELEGWVHAVSPVGAYVPIYEAMGNHESLVEAWEAGWAIGRVGESSAERLFAQHVVNPQNGPDAEAGAPPYAENVYSFDHGVVHVAVVNSNYWWRSHPDRKDHPGLPRGQREGWVNDAMITWLDQDLAAARQRGARYLFVGTHEPGFPNGGHAQDAMYWNGEVPEVLEQRAKFFRVLGKHGVSVLFAGDEHNYSRTRIDEELVPNLSAPVWQIISGGAGAPYYAQERSVPWGDHVEVFDTRQHFVVVKVAPRTAVAEVVALSGEVIDRFDLAAPKD